MLSIIAIFYVSIFVPFNISFPITVDYTIVDNVFNIFMYADVLITIFTINYVNGIPEENIVDIISRYLTGWFFVDFMCLFPFDLVLTANSGVGQLAKLSRIFKLIKIARLIKISNRMTNSNFLKKYLNYFQFNSMYTELISFCLIIVLITHLLGCVIYFFTSFEYINWSINVIFLNKSVAELYIASIYWIVTTICTVGFGDITPKNSFEIVIITFAIIIGVVVVSFFIGMLSNIQNTENAKTNIIMNRFNQLSFYEENIYKKQLIFENITNTLEFYEDNLNFLEKDEYGFMNEISLNIIYKISKFVNKDLIENQTIFKNKDIDFIAQILPLIKPRVFKQGEIIYYKGDSSNFIYFLVNGIIGFTSENNMVYKSYIGGSYFGEIESLNGGFRKTNCISLSNSYCFVLPKNSFIKKIKALPIIYEEILYNSIIKSILNKKALLQMKSFYFLNFNQNIKDSFQKCILKHQKNLLISTKKIKKEIIKYSVYAKKRFRNKVKKSKTKNLLGYIIPRTNQELKLLKTISNKRMTQINNLDLNLNTKIDQISNLNKIKKQFKYVTRSIFNINQTIIKFLTIVQTQNICIKSDVLTKSVGVQYFANNFPKNKKQHNDILINLNSIEEKSHDDISLTSSSDSLSYISDIKINDKKNEKKSSYFKSLINNTNQEIKSNIQELDYLDNSFYQIQYKRNNLMSTERDLEEVEKLNKPKKIKTRKFKKIVPLFNKK